MTALARSLTGAGFLLTWHPTEAEKEVMAQAGE
jgi:hypothetical protein